VHAVMKTDTSAGKGHTSDVVRLERARAALAEHPLLGDRPGRLLDLNNVQLLYILTILRDEGLEPPELSREEWAYMLTILERHRIMPSIAKKASVAHTLQCFPEYAQLRMKKSYVNAVALALYRERTLKEIIPAFERAGVKVLVLKGAAMAHYAYSDPALRQGSDIDLLVSPDDVRSTGTVLESLGYKCNKKNFNVSTRRNHEEVYMYGVPSAKRPPIEIHWNLFPFFMFNQQADLRPVFERAISIDVNGFSFKAMHPADALCHEATHMIYGHKGEIRMNWIVDIGLLCNKLESPEDRVLLQRTSVDCMARIAVEKSIKMAQVWTGVQMPEEFGDFSRWPRPSRKEASFNSYYNTHNPVSGLKLALSGGRDLRDTLRELRQHAFPSTEVMRARYPEMGRWPVALMYVRRWLKLIANR
jgi:hypothetical protein